MIKLMLLKEEEVMVGMEADAILIGVDLILQRDIALELTIILPTIENNSMKMIQTASKTRPPLYVKYMENTTTLLLNVGVALITPFNWRTVSVNFTLIFLFYFINV